ncbi:anaerobic ribonucleoside-triphosphate reductase, large subunit [Shigella phage Silverhawkium]|uniref:Anaerobic ribonucleoside-triphosphate reductase, large subunit n=1 Tax=Shigella phage Silverhawkium TaxID=2530185 RepID=A0A482JK42_9CAUD|nr:anaerobic ribonucleoside-triphosphate reductase, large subunit [Shigella phage Silverhawkium]
MVKVQIIKKNGSLEEPDIKKVLAAVTKSANRVGYKELPLEVAHALESAFMRILVKACNQNTMLISVDDIHSIVEGALAEVNHEIYESYSTYRNYRKEVAQNWDELYQKTKDTLFLGDRENANFDSSLISTKGSIIRGYLTKEIFKQYHLTPEEAKAIEEGFIYIHDLRDLVFGGINCCLFDIGKVLEGGFEMSGIEYCEPKSVLSALQVIGDVVLSATAQQFGGFTIPEIDKVLVPYAKKSQKYHEEMAIAYGIPKENIYHYVKNQLQIELTQGFQSLEMKLNTVPCSRGDFAFTTLTFGLLEPDMANEDNRLQYMIAKTILDVRMNGQGKAKKPVVFPKLVYIYDKTRHNLDIWQGQLYSKAIECCSKAMYPDFLSVSGHGAVADAFKRSGKVISPMGCRAYLSPYFDEDGKEFYVGRANIGAVSLNLPMIYQYAKENQLDFFAEIDKYLEMIRVFHQKRYEMIANMPASSNPLAFTQGGLYKGNKKPTDKIGWETVKSFTASFGVTALDELSVLAGEGRLHEANSKGIAHQVMEHLNHKLEQFKQEDGFLYALYGTPAESLCGTQLKQFRNMFGVIKGVSDKEYFTNSFHMNVAAEITPFEKQDLEEPFFHSCNGGHIIYSRMANPENKKAISACVSRGMGKGFYQGVNFDLAICENCGHRPNEDVDECPKCHSHDISVINRVCGYLGWTKIKGTSRMNDAKIAEIKDRVCM